MELCAYVVLQYSICHRICLYGGTEVSCTGHLVSWDAYTVYILQLRLCVGVREGIYLYSMQFWLVRWLVIICS